MQIDPKGLRYVLEIYWERYQKPLFVDRKRDLERKIIRFIKRTEAWKLPTITG